MKIKLSLYDRISTNKNASVNQQAKLGVCCPDPEGRNTALFLAFDGRNKERENIVCPCCSFELHAMKTSVNYEIYFYVDNEVINDSRSSSIS